MFKRYDYQLVHGYRSYTIKEICRLFKRQNLHEQTVRRWIKEELLDAILDGNKLLIYGGSLKQFLKDRNKNRRHTPRINDFFCCKCKKINPPLENIIVSAIIQNNGSIRLSGLCPSCTSDMNRIYKSTDITQIKQMFVLEPKALIVLSDSLCTNDNAHHRVDKRLAESESNSHELSDATHDLDISEDLI